MALGDEFPLKLSLILQVLLVAGLAPLGRHVKSFAVVGLEEERADGDPVSSTRIRRALTQGKTVRVVIDLEGVGPEPEIDPELQRADGQPRMDPDQPLVCPRVVGLAAGRG